MQGGPGLPQPLPVGPGHARQQQDHAGSTQQTVDPMQNVSMQLNLHVILCKIGCCLGAVPTLDES